MALFMSSPLRECCQAEMNLVIFLTQWWAFTFSNSTSWHIEKHWDCQHGFWVWFQLNDFIHEEVSTKTVMVEHASVISEVRTPVKGKKTTGHWPLMVCCWGHQVFQVSQVRSQFSLSHPTSDKHHNLHSCLWQLLTGPLYFCVVVKYIYIKIRISNRQCTKQNKVDTINTGSSLQFQSSGAASHTYIAM